MTDNTVEKCEKSSRWTNQLHCKRSRKASASIFRPRDVEKYNPARSAPLLRTDRQIHCCQQTITPQDLSRTQGASGESVFMMQLCPPSGNLSPVPLDTNHSSQFSEESAKKKGIAPTTAGRREEKAVKLAAQPRGATARACGPPCSSPRRRRRTPPRGPERRSSGSFRESLRVQRENPASNPQLLPAAPPGRPGKRRILAESKYQQI